MVLARSGRELPRPRLRRPGRGGAAPPRGACAPGGVRVRLELEPAGVSGERRLLERLAGNLIENGVRYNAPGGFVAVRTSSVDGGAVLDVVNCGPVIDPAWPRGWSSRSSAAAAPAAAARASGSRSCARWPRRTAGGSR